VRAGTPPSGLPLLAKAFGVGRNGGRPSDWEIASQCNGFNESLRRTAIVKNLLAKASEYRRDPRCDPNLHDVFRAIGLEQLKANVNPPYVKNLFDRTAAERASFYYKRL
jgi:hypothetical protein